MTADLPRTDTAAALRLIGKRGDIHPVDAAAFIYPDRQTFDWHAARDREVHHNDVIGPVETADGLVGIIDLRPQLLESGIPWTDPYLPDDAAGPDAEQVADHRERTCWASRYPEHAAAEERAFREYLLSLES